MPPLILAAWVVLTAPPPPPMELPSPGGEASTCAEAWRAEGAPRQQAGNCQAPLAITEEVTRLLVAAAAHCTHSRACLDGPGERVAVNDVRVCFAANPTATATASYCFTRHPEGDTRGCGAVDDCPWFEPSATVHELTLRFRKDDGRLLLQLPEHLPGADGCAPLTQPHDGGCYGRSRAFEPRAIPLPLK